MGNPTQFGDSFYVSLSMDVEDGNKLQELFEKWYAEDYPETPTEKSIWKKFTELFDLSPKGA